MKQATFWERFNRIKLCLILFLTFLLLKASGQGKIVGYIPTNYTTASVDFTKITHLNLAFENPNDAGDLSYNSGNDAFVSAAHANNVKVLVSICGGGASNDPVVQQRYFNLISPANRTSFINKIIGYVNAHNLDGIDLDLEGPAINSDYSAFVIELRNTMPADKLVTAALSHENGGNAVSSLAVQTFDFLNIMAYDMGWGQPVHHSTYEYATTCANWWITNKGLPASKVVLGVPFYGYTNTTGSGGISFASI
jgi:chitinase